MQDEKQIKNLNIEAEHVINGNRVGRSAAAAWSVLGPMMDRESQSDWKAVAHEMWRARRHLANRRCVARGSPVSTMLPRRVTGPRAKVNLMRSCNSKHRWVSLIWQDIAEPRWNTYAVTPGRRGCGVTTTGPAMRRRWHSWTRIKCIR